VGKSNAESAAARAKRVADARAEIAGPLLYAALKPVAERARASHVYQARGHHEGCGDNVVVVLTMPEVRKILAAVEKADRYGQVTADE
jgi:hypothetical protein